MKTARYWRTGNGPGEVVCELCPHGCRMVEGRSGICRVRGARDGEVKALGYGLVSSAGLDPIEKKPLYHFHPGSSIFSIGGWGCNLGCVFCQNWSISQQFIPDGDRYLPEQIVHKASLSESVGIAYTYNEPLVGFEFVYDCAALARRAGLANVLVTNGYVRKEPASELLPLIDAINLDIKSMDESFYRKECHATLQPVLDFAQRAVDAGVRLEITNLVIPGRNDSTDGIARLAKWIRDNLGESTPLHLSAYRPEYKLREPPTPVERLNQLWDVARRDLPYVYLGNIQDGKGQDTGCPACQRILVERRGYSTRIVGIEKNLCKGCGRPVDILVDRPRSRRPAPL